MAVVLFSWILPPCSYRDVQCVPLDRSARYLDFQNTGQACQLLTRGRQSFLINCTVLLPACVCQTTSIAWLTHQFKVAWFVGCPATVGNPPFPSTLPPHLPFCLPAAGIEAFSHAWGVFSSQRAARLYYSETAITERFKDNIGTLGTVLLCVYSWRPAADEGEDGWKVKTVRGLLLSSNISICTLELVRVLYCFDSDFLVLPVSRYWPNFIALLSWFIL